MPQVTIDLDEAVFRALTALSAQEGRAVGAVAASLLEDALREPLRAPDAATRFAWTTSALGVPSVDLSDCEAVRRALDVD